MTKKLNPSDLEEFRNVLLRLKQEITGDIQDLENDAFLTDGMKASVDNPADVGSDSFAQEFSLELLARDEETLGEIVEALERLDRGGFGSCEACEGAIGKTRLRAVPYARNCIDCQRALEREA